MADYPSQSPFQVEPALAGRLAAAKEAVWFRIGVLQSTMNDRERALEAFERALAVNPVSVRAMTQAGAILAKKECYPQAVAYLQRAISAEATYGEAWAVLAHCYVMTDDLQKAYQAYQSALSHLPNPRDPNLWYGIGLLYDRYGSLDNALEAFLAVLSISPDFERADEVCFCIGIIYKEQQNFDEALKYFNKVVVAANPPPPLTRADGWYQIGHVNELKRDIPVALDMYRHALAENPKHPKTLQNFGWLEHQHSKNSPEAIRLLKLSADLDPSDGQTWYLLGRVYMALKEYRQAYDAYQQAVYRDGRNATFWCSIGVLYYEMNQYRDAMDAYSRAIRLNPYVSEVWYDLGTLYESCGQNADAIDAYRRAAELAPENAKITARLAVLEGSMNPAQQQATAQPHLSAQQPQPHMPPQLQPDMHHASQQQHMQSSQLNPVLNRPMAPPIQQLSQPLEQQKLPPHQLSSLPPSQLPPTQQGPLSTSAAQQASNSQNAAAMSGLPRSGQMEISPIASLRPQNLPQSQSMGQNGTFSHDGRPSLPVPLSSVQHSTSHHSAGMNHLSPMVSQPLLSQPLSSVLQPPALNSSHPDTMHSFRPRPGSLPHAHLQPLSNHHLSQDQQRPRHPAHLSHPEAQHSLSQPRLPHMYSSQPMHVYGQSQGDMQQPHIPHPQAQNLSSPPGQGQDPSQQRPQQTDIQQGQHVTQGLQQQPSQIPQQHSPHSQSQQNRQLGHSNGLSQIQPLPQLQSLPRMQHQSSDHRKSQELKAVTEPHRAREQDNDRPGYMQTKVESLGRQDYEGNEERQDSRFPKIPKVDGIERSRGFPPASDGVASSQPLYSSHGGGMVTVSSTGNQIPSIREPGIEPGNAGPPPTRAMSMHELTQTERHGQPRRSDDGNRDTRGDVDPIQNEPQVEKGQVSDRLPALSSISGQVNNSNRESREDARLLTSMATPSLPAAPSNAAQSQVGGDNQKPSTSPLAGPGGSGSSGLRASAPPLPPMPSRTSSSLGGTGQENKEVSINMGSSGNGVSSLTKFGKGLARTPATPAHSSVAPSSLPSPLPARKGSGGVVHAVRSPRIPKPSSAPSLKSVPIPPVLPSQIGQIESVPSPSSLPVLPALSSHPSNSENDKAAVKDKNSDQDTGIDDGDGESRTIGTKGDDKLGKDSSTGRKSEDGMMNKPLFGILRSAPAPMQVDVDRTEKEEKVKSSVSSGGRQDSEAGSALKRASSKDDSGRTAKRPRLHDLKDQVDQKEFSRYGDDSKKVETKSDTERKDEDLKGVHSSGKSDIPSYKEMKGSNTGSQPSESDKSGKRDRIVESDVSKSLPKVAQVIDLPRLSTPMTRSGPPSLPGNTPLPSFRSERMKSTSQDNTSRSSLPFALRSAPVSSLPAPLKGHLQSSSRSVERDYGISAVDEPMGKRISEDKQDSGMGGNNSREDVVADRVTNGETQKGSGSREPDSRGESAMNAKDEKQSGRTEIHSSAT